MTIRQTGSIYATVKCVICQFVRGSNTHVWDVVVCASQPTCLFTANSRSVFLKAQLITQSCRNCLSLSCVISLLTMSFTAVLLTAVFTRDEHLNKSVFSHHVFTAFFTAVFTRDGHNTNMRMTKSGSVQHAQRRRKVRGRYFYFVNRYIHFMNRCVYSINLLRIASSSFSVSATKARIPWCRV